MLAKIDDVYLNVLRLAILVVAGLALLAAAAGLVFGAINGARGIFASNADARGRSLAEFVVEKRLAVEQVAGQPRGSAPAKNPDPVPLSEAINRAVDVFAAYLNRQTRNTVSKAELVTRLNERWLSVPAGYDEAYDASLGSLTREISSSTGRPLSRDRVLELIDWHHASLVDQAGRVEAARADASAQAWMWIGRAAQAFLLFVAIAFYFLLVRVERHLRVVKVVRVEEASGETATGEQR